MTDPRNVAHDNKLVQEKRHQGILAAHEHPEPGKSPHQQPQPGNHGPDPDEPLDQTESGQEP